MFKRFLRDRSGMSAVEYGLITALISAALIVGAGNLGNSIDNQFGSISDDLNDSR